MRKTKDFLIGASNEKLTRKLRCQNNADIVKGFHVCVKKAFINIAIYMQEKFPLTNKFLMCLSGLDPTAIGHPASYACLKKLADFFPTILTSTEKTDNYLKEISTLQLDGSLPSALEENDGQRFFKLATIQFYHKWLKLLVFQFVFQNTN